MHVYLYAAAICAGFANVIVLVAFAHDVDNIVSAAYDEQLLGPDILWVTTGTTTASEVAAVPVVLEVVVLAVPAVVAVLAVAVVAVAVVTAAAAVVVVVIAALTLPLTLNRILTLTLSLP